MKRSEKNNTDNHLSSSPEIPPPSASSLEETGGGGPSGYQSAQVREAIDSEPSNFRKQVFKGA